MAFQLIFNSRCVAYAFDMFARFSRRTGKVIERQVIKLVLLVLPPFRVVRAAPPSPECERAQGPISGLCRDVNLESGCHAVYYTQSPRRLQAEFFLGVSSQPAAHAAHGNVNEDKFSGWKQH